MSLGKLVRLNRLFSHPSGRLCSVAVDHFIGYGTHLPASLAHTQATLEAIVAGRPDAVTMHKGMALGAWAPFAGRVPLIMQSTIGRADDTANEQIATPEEAVRLGADAFAVTMFVCGATEAAHMRMAADCVREAGRFDIPLVCHVYPRRFTDAGVQISLAAEDIAWAVHCAFEVGADVIKVPYCGDGQAFGQIVADTPAPVVAAGGPRQDSLETALQMIYEAVQSGVRGATVGRNVWSFPRIADAVRAFRAVVHDGKRPAEAMRMVGK